jgi:hypothetical protein
MIRTEPIRAWRVWRLRGSGPFDAEPVLESCIYGDVWPARQAFSAACFDHPLPARDCGCGIYAVTTRPAALALALWARSALPNPIVYGQVHLWGRVLVHSAGYRAERAYPYELALLDDPRCPETRRRALEGQLRARYLVDVLPGASAAA